MQQQQQQYNCVFIIFFSKKATGSGKAAKPTLVYLLNTRGNNLSLALFRVIQSNEDIKNTILEAKDGVLSSDDLETLIDFSPTQEEIQSISRYTGDPSLLGIGEKYVSVIQAVPRLDRKLSMMLLKEQFTVRVAKLDVGITMVTNAAREITNSTKLLKFLEAVLGVGNYLNTGGENVRAHCSKLDALMKLLDTKATGRGINLLHDGISLVEQCYPEVLNFPEEMPSIPKAAALPIAKLSTDLLTLENDIKAIGCELATTDDASTQFRYVFETFAALSTAKVENVKQKLAAMNSSVRDMFSHFGDDPGKVNDAKNIEEFYKFMVSFCRLLETSKKDLAKEKEAARKKSEREGKIAAGENLEKSVDLEKKRADDEALNHVPLNLTPPPPPPLPHSGPPFSVASAPPYSSAEVSPLLSAPFVPPPSPPPTPPSNSASFPPMLTDQAGRIKLKHLNWSKLTDDVVETSLWKSADKFPINTDEIDLLFFSEDNEVNLLKPKRANNIAVALSWIKGLTPEDIKSAVLQAGVLSSHYLLLLLQCIPTNDEADAIREFIGDVSSLGVAEKYFMVMVTVPRLEAKLSAMLLKERFKARTGKLHDDIITVTDAACAIVSSTKFVTLLEAVLAIGNYLNTESKNGQATGFKLDVLQKLLDTTVSARRMNLLQYVISVVERYSPHILNFPDEMSAVAKAASLPIRNLARDLQELKNELGVVAVELDMSDETSEKFRCVFKSFVASSLLELESVELNLNEMNDTASKMFLYFGYNPKKVESPEHIEKVFKILVGFFQSFKTAKRELSREMAGRSFDNWVKNEPRKGLPIVTAAAPPVGLNAKPVYVPRVRLKQLNWSKLPTYTVMRSVWMTANDIPINTEEIESLFCATVAKPSVAADKRPDKPTTINLLDMRKGSNIAIGLAHMKGLSHEDIKHAVLEAKEGVLSTEHLEMLLKFVPTLEEIHTIKEYKGDTNLLGTAEKYFLVISEVPYLSSKLSAMLLREQFSFRIATVNVDIITVTNAARELMNSSKLLKCLEAVLGIGNYLNAGGRNAQAYGFRLDALKKLVDTKATGRRINLLHYVVSQLETYYPRVLSLLEDVPSVGKASTVPIHMLSIYLHVLDKEVNSIAKLLDTVDPESNKFRTGFAPFVALAEAEMEHVTKNLVEMNNTAAKMFLHFGDVPNKIEDPKNIEEFYKLMASFFHSFENAKRDLVREKMDIAKAAAREKTKALAVDKKGTKTDKMSNSTGVEEGRGVLDDLFSYIKKGNFRLKEFVGNKKSEMKKEDIAQGGKETQL